MSTPANGTATPLGRDVPAFLEQAAGFITTEYASLTRAGDPVTWPVTPYAGLTGTTLDVATGLTYPLKAERARRDPRVALSFSYPVGSGLDPAPTYLVQGLATVRDADLRATSSRYLQASADRFPEHSPESPPSSSAGWTGTGPASGSR
jgi:hypothetical protein